MPSSLLLRLAFVFALVIPGVASAQQKTSSQSKYDGVTVQRGVTQDPSFNNWATGTQSGAQPPSKGDTSGKYQSIPLQSGVTHDSSFNNWATGTSPSPKTTSASSSRTKR